MEMIPKNTMDCKKNQSIGLGWNKDRLLPQGNDQQAYANILLGHERPRKDYYN